MDCYIFLLLVNQTQSAAAFMRPHNLTYRSRESCFAIPESVFCSDFHKKHKRLQFYWHMNHLTWLSKGFDYFFRMLLMPPALLLKAVWSLEAESHFCELFPLLRTLKLQIRTKKSVSTSSTAPSGDLKIVIKSEIWGEKGTHNFRRVR